MAGSRRWCTLPRRLPSPGDVAPGRRRVTRFQLLVLIIAAANAAVAIVYFTRALVASHRARRRAPGERGGP
jgi:hypothetical protein